VFADSTSLTDALELMQPDEPPRGDKIFKRYSNSVDRSLSLFDTALLEWADYISFLSRLLKVRTVCCCLSKIKVLTRDFLVYTIASSQYYCSTLEVDCGKTSSTMFESITAVRGAPKDP
jgi:hypothetical protein